MVFVEQDTQKQGNTTELRPWTKDSGSQTVSTISFNSVSPVQLTHQALGSKLSKEVCLAYTAPCPNSMVSQVPLAGDNPGGR